jgi:hypothetical protein
LESRSHLS